MKRIAILALLLAAALCVASTARVTAGTSTGGLHTCGSIKAKGVWHRVILEAGRSASQRRVSLRETPLGSLPQVSNSRPRLEMPSASVPEQEGGRCDRTSRPLEVGDGLQRPDR